MSTSEREELLARESGGGDPFGVVADRTKLHYDERPMEDEEPELQFSLLDESEQEPKAVFLFGVAFGSEVGPDSFSGNPNR